MSFVLSWWHISALFFLVSNFFSRSQVRLSKRLWRERWSCPFLKWRWISRLCTRVWPPTGTVPAPTLSRQPPESLSQVETRSHFHSARTYHTSKKIWQTLWLLGLCVLGGCYCFVVFCVASAVSCPLIWLTPQPRSPHTPHDRSALKKHIAWPHTHTVPPPGWTSVSSQHTMSWREKHHDQFSLSTEADFSLFSLSSSSLLPRPLTRVSSTNVFWILPLPHRVEVRELSCALFLYDIAHEFQLGWTTLNQNYYTAHCH